MTKTDFINKVKTLYETSQSILLKLEHGVTPNVTHLDDRAWDIFVAELNDVNFEMFEPRRFGRGLPDEGRAG